jgi:hypothetical protein
MCANIVPIATGMNAAVNVCGLNKFHHVLKPVEEVGD